MVNLSNMIAVTKDITCLIVGHLQAAAFRPSAGFRRFSYRSNSWQSPRPSSPSLYRENRVFFPLSDGGEGGGGGDGGDVSLRKRVILVYIDKRRPEMATAVGGVPPLPPSRSVRPIYKWTSASSERVRHSQSAFRVLCVSFVYFKYCSFARGREDTRAIHGTHNTQRRREAHPFRPRAAATQPAWRVRRIRHFRFLFLFV